MAKAYFCAYHSMLEAMEPLSDAECGRLFRACLDYSMHGAAPELSGNERFVFPLLKQQIDRDNNSYEAMVQKNALNGLKGGRPRKEENAFKNPTVISKTQKSQEEEKEKEDVKEERNPPLPPKGEDVSFDVFWQAYPRKVGKAAARKAYAKLNADAQLISRILVAIAEQKKTHQWQKEQGQYIPNPATWLNQARWEDEQGTPSVTVKRVAHHDYLQRDYDEDDLSELKKHLSKERTNST